MIPYGDRASVPRSPLRKVVIVNTSDQGGGAERISVDILDGFNALGTDTWLLVGEKKTDHPRVVPFYLSPFLDYRPYDKVWRRAALAGRRRVARALGLEDFEHPYAHRILDLTGSPPDLVLCHNLHGGYFDLRALARLSRRVPVVLRLFDSWLLTGHCANPLGCPRWQTKCGRCPDLTIPPAIRRDATRLNWWRKQRMLQHGRFFVSAESQWMIDRIAGSLLAPALTELKLIAGGVDLDTFCPGSQSDARRELGIDPDTDIILFVANLGPESPFKDFSTVRDAVAALARHALPRPVQLLAVGSAGEDEQVAPAIAIRRLDYISSPLRLANLYRAADVFVHAAVEETFGLSVAEALACGTPVVTASRGGVLEIVEHERTALVVPPRRRDQLALALATLLKSPSLRARMGAAAAASARAHLDRRIMLERLHSWCSDIHAGWATAPN